MEADTHLIEARWEKQDASTHPPDNLLFLVEVCVWFLCGFCWFLAWLFGGKADDLLVGGAGNDKLDGNDGRDILVGGTGADKLKGKGGEDILIAGSTVYDNNLAALLGIHQEWQSTNSFADRVQNIFDGSGTASSANGAYFFNNATVSVSDGGMAS